MVHHYSPLWLLVTLVAGVAEDNNYCSLRYRRLCQGKGRHVGCQFPEPGAGPSCRNYAAITFTSELKHFITHFVNRRRQRIAAGLEKVKGGLHVPKPKVMMMVEWDRELASLAQKLADQCHFIHDDCRATVRYPYAGQSVGEVRWRRSSESDEMTAQRAIRKVLDAWWGNKRRVQPSQLITPFKLTTKGISWGDFSQLAVWDLQAVGCGAVRHGDPHPRLLLVCDFSHTNMLGQSTIDPGPQAPCPIHFARRPRGPYPLLCASVRNYAPEGQDSEDQYDDIEEQTSEDDQDVTSQSTSILTTTRRTSKPVERFKVSKPPDEEYFNTVQVYETSRRRMFSFATKRTIDTSYRPTFENRETGLWQYTRRLQHGRHWWPEESEEEAAVSIVVASEFPLMTPDYAEPRSRTTDQEHSAFLRRWQPVRNRPRRPGESNLLLTRHTRIEQTKKPAVARLTLDMEDSLQLFKDTGFSSST